MTRRRPPELYLRACFFYAGLVSFTLVFAPLAIAALVIPYRARYRLVVQWSRLACLWLRVTCRVDHRVEGLENIPDRAAVILSKHESAWETMMLQRYFSPQAWVLKRELLRIPFFGWGLATLRPIAIDRSAGKTALDQVVEQGVERLRDGIWIVVFPEGTRVAPGTRRRYKLGGAMLASSTGTPVVPVAHDAGDYWPRRSFVKWPGTIRLVIGPPIDTEGLDAHEINRRAEAWIEATMTRLRGTTSTLVRGKRGGGI